MKEKNPRMQVFLNGLYRENPVLVSAVGICAMLFKSYDLRTAFSAGVITAVALVFAEAVMSALKRVIPRGVRIPCRVLIIVSAVTLVRLLLSAYVPFLYAAFEPYSEMLMVSCLIFGRTEEFAAKNTVANSAIDGIGVGIGYTVVLSVLGAARELLGNGTILGAPVLSGFFRPIPIFVMAPGALFLMGCLIALINKFRSLAAADAADLKEGGEKTEKEETQI